MAKILAGTICFMQRAIKLNCVDRNFLHCCTTNTSSFEDKRKHKQTVWARVCR